MFGGENGILGNKNRQKEKNQVGLFNGEKNYNSFKIKELIYEKTYIYYRWRYQYTFGNGYPRYFTYVCSFI